MSWAMPIPQHSHVQAGNGSLYWATTDGTNATAGAFHGLWNFAGAYAATLPIFDAEFFTSGLSDSTFFNGNLLIQPQGSSKATPVAGSSIATWRANSKNVYIYLDGAAGSSCGVAYAFCIVPNDNEPFIIKSLPTSAGTVNGSLCIDVNNQVYIKTTSGACK